MIALGIVAFVIALLLSILLHEAGHFATARAFGMKASRFFVGFGPTLWSTKRGETEYGIKAIPAGGFVKIEGMTPLDEVPPEDEQRAFYKQHPLKRILVLSAGSTVHFIIGFLLLFVLFVAYPNSTNGTATVISVAPCVTQTDPANCTSADPASPASGKLQQGDVVTAVDGKRVTGGSEGLSKAIAAGGTDPVTLTVTRDGHTDDITMTPVEADGRARLGVVIGPTYVRSSPLASVGHAGSTFGQAFVGSFTALGSVPHVLHEAVSSPDQTRSVDDGGQVTSVVGVARFAGEAFQAGGFSGGVATLIALLASVNIFVGIFNMFPLLPLDGGHVAIILFERARAGVARLFRRPDPGPVDLVKLMPVTYVALFVIVGASVLLLYADAVNPIANPFQ